MAEWKYISRNLWRSYSLVWWFTEKKFWPSDDRLCCILQRKKKWREWNDLEKKVLVSDFEFKNQWQFCVAKIFSVCLCVCKRKRDTEEWKIKWRREMCKVKKAILQIIFQHSLPPTKPKGKLNALLYWGQILLIKRKKI